MVDLYKALVSLPVVDRILTGYATVVTPQGETDIVRQGFDVYTMDERGYTLNEILSIFYNQTIWDVIVHP